MDFDWLTIHLDKIDTLPEWVSLLFFLSAIGLAFWYIFNKQKSESNQMLSDKTIEVLQKNNSALEDRITVVEAETKECNERSARDREASDNQHKESRAQIHLMQGKLEAYEGLTLVSKEVITDLSTSMKKNVDNTAEILETLKSSAVTLKHDTAQAKTAVRTVKADLKGAV